METKNLFAELKKQNATVLPQNVGGKSKSIYKKELFAECKNDKEKKAMRIKLRRETKKFLGAFLQKEKNIAELNVIRKAWQNYAKQVYVNVNQIFDTNTKEDEALIKRFVQIMNAPIESKKESK